MTGQSTVHDGDPSTGRAQAEVLSIVLLIGLVSIAALGVLLVAGGAMSDSQEEAEKERIEQSFVELSQTMATASVNGEMAQQMEFDAGDSGAITKTNVGQITVKSGDTGTVIVNRSIGAIEYQHDDGSIVAYQAGGVWAGMGNQTRLVSAPRMTYDLTSETLTLPITTVSDEQDLSSGPISVGLNRTEPVQNATTVENETVEMTIESPYYQGWADFFRTKAGDGVVRDVDHANQSITVQFGAISLDEALTRGATYGEEPESGTDGEADHTEEITEDGALGNLRPIDGTINQLVSDANDGSLQIDRDYGDITSDMTVTSGVYFADSIDGGSHEFDVSSGNITLIVDGNIKSDGEGDFITVTNPTDDHHLKIYTTGHLDIQQGGNICVETCNNGGDSERLQLYGTSETTVNINTGDPSFEGILYVASDRDSWEYSERSINNCPTDKYQVAFQADINFTGSLIAETICARSSSYTFTYDSSLDGANVDPYPPGYAPPPRITYLNVAVHDIDVANP